MVKLFKIFRNIYQKYRYIFRLNGKVEMSEVLFEGDDELFKKVVSLHATAYAEYGSGQSTLWMSKNFSGPILSVDSSQFWINQVASQSQMPCSLRLHWVDLGELESWGRPLGYSKWAHFEEYTEWVWLQGVDPNVVLIDGRFRVCCFFTTLLYAKPGTYVFFDDYTDRPHYHYVEQFIQPVQLCGRQALFIVPEISDKSFHFQVREEMLKFRYVMEWLRDKKFLRKIN
jgi:hypothetical protein